LDRDIGGGRRQRRGKHRAADSGLRRFRQPEVEQLRDWRPGRARAREEDVGGFEIAMDDAGPVRLVERVSDLDRDPQRVVDVERAKFQTSLERFALQELHDQERPAVLVPDVVERADVGMIQLRDRPRLAVEPFAKLRVGGQRFGQDLDRDDAIEPRIASLIDLAHAARSDGGENLVRAEAGTGGKGQTACRGLYERGGSADSITPVQRRSVHRPGPGKRRVGRRSVLSQCSNGRNDDVGVGIVKIGDRRVCTTGVMRSAAIWSRNLQQRLETTRQRAALDELEDAKARDRQLLEVAARRRTIGESRRGVPTDRGEAPGMAGCNGHRN
jgi:hypothetical protein